MREHCIDQTSTYIRTDENMNECDQTGIYMRIDESMNECKILHRTWRTRDNFRHVNWEGETVALSFRHPLFDISY
jgi:hypothetical protein